MYKKHMIKFKYSMVLRWPLLLLLLLLSQPSLASKDSSLLSINTAGHGRPLVLIPGLMSDPRVWSGLVDKLSSKYQLHLIAVRGFGATPVEGRFNFKSLRQELAEYINSLDKPIIVGHSLGGFLAMAQAIEHPDSVSGVVSVDGLPFIGPVLTRDNGTTVADLEPQANYLRQLYTSMNKDQFDQFIQQGLPIQASGQPNRDIIFDMSRQSAPVVVGEALYALMSTDLRPGLSKIKTSLLLLGASGGVEGQFEKEQIRSIYQQQLTGVALAKTQMNERARHFIMLEDPVWLHAQLVAYVEGIYQ